MATRHSPERGAPSGRTGVLWVLVTLPDETLPTGAKVSAAGATGRKVSLKYDRRRRHYVSGPLPPGKYRVTVRVRGYLTEERTVEVQGSRRRVDIYPGKRGMKAYWAGRTRIPFTPMRCIGVYLEKGVSRRRQAALIRYCERELRMERRQVSEALEKGRHPFLLFDYGDASDREVATRIRALRERDEVRHAGAALRVRERNARLLSDRIVVRFKTWVQEEQIRSLAKELGLSPVSRPGFAGNARIFRSPDPGTYAVLDTVAALAGREDVDYAEADAFINVVDDLDPDDPYYASATTPASNANYQWYLTQCTVDDAWDITTGSSDVIVAVCDSGFDPTHEDFSGKVYLSVNLEPDGGAVDAYSAYTQDSNHGMAVSGVAAAQGDNTTGVAGVAMDCQILGVNRPYSGYQSYIANMLVWVAGFDPVEVFDESIVYPSPPDPGADVIENAYGVSGDALDGIMQDALDFVTTYGRGGKGCVVIFSSGNSGQDFVSDPSYKRVFASYEKTVAVGACRQDETWDSGDPSLGYSNYGSALDLVAPGGDRWNGPHIVTTTLPGMGSFTGYAEGLDYGDGYTDPDSDTADVRGTSFSAPQVAGAAALMLSVHPDLTWVQVRDILRDTARQIDTGNPDPLAQYDADGHSDYYGHGILDCAAAVQAADDALTGDAPDLWAHDETDDDGDVPYEGSTFWLSPDLWNRQADPASDDPIDYVNHEDPIRDQPNYLWGRITNRGGADSGAFYVRFYLTHFPGTEFLWPDDFIPDATPSDVTSLASLPRGTYLIGEYAHEGLVAGDADEIWVEWPADLIPPDEVDEGDGPVSWHPCLLMEISPHDSEYNGSIPYNVWDSNDVVQRNISIEDADSDGDTFTTALVVGHEKNPAPWLQLEVDRGDLPRQVELYVRYGLDADWKRSVELLREPEDAARQAWKTFQVRFDTDARVTVLGDECCRVRITVPRGGKIEFECCGGVRPPRFEVTPVYVAGKRALRLATKRRVAVPVWVRGGRTVPMILQGRVPAGTPTGDFTLRLVQRQPDGTASGGFGVEVRVR